MPFLETTFAPTPAFGFQGGPQFQTTVVTLASGRELRNVDWSVAKHSYSSPFLNISLNDFRNIKSLFMACRGQAYGFRFRDWMDYQADNEPVGVSDGVTLVWQLIKTSTADSISYVRTIKKPVADSFQLFTTAPGEGNEPVIQDPSSYSLDTTTGLVTLTGVIPAGATISWSGTFDVPVRFASDLMQFTYDNLNATNNTGLLLVEDPEA
jgi:uncharacterized protein (TIGR02217 family)